MNGNRKMKKVAVAGLSAVLCTSLAAGGAIIANHNSNSKADTGSTQELASDKYDVEYLKAAVEKAANVVSASDTQGELFKDETVYALADANGTTNKIIVSDWLKNAGKETDPGSHGNHNGKDAGNGGRADDHRRPHCSVGKGDHRSGV